ncbi:cation:dicarboxylate symporter family transporter [Legionella tunisiensis]|uniref:cation:dicarboxylate symporter family transporter n=1 Tax=Legionella tunisiensis TaxID=1034944 RepID=UPI00030B4CDF|nr:cation:dicarboxylase symporter family transporter [Legionella tunisiensis]
MESYVRISVIYYVASLIYFIAAYTFYAYLAGKTGGIKIFWKNVWLPATTAIATCSSAASIPANLIATK